MVSVVVEETRIVVVVNEHSQGVDIVEFVLFLRVPAANAVFHALIVLPNVYDGVIHGVVEQASEVVLVRSDITRVSVEHLSHLEHSSIVCVLLPEVFGYFRNSVNPNSVKIVGFNYILNPGFEVTSHILVLLVKVRKV